MAFQPITPEAPTHKQEAQKPAPIQDSDPAKTAIPWWKRPFVRKEQGVIKGFFSPGEMEKILATAHKHLDLLRSTKAIADTEPSPTEPNKLLPHIGTYINKQGVTQNMFDHAFIDRAVAQAQAMLHGNEHAVGPNLFSEKHLAYLRKLLARGDSPQEITDAASFLAQELLRNVAKRIGPNMLTDVVQIDERGKIHINQQPIDQLLATWGNVANYQQEGTPEYVIQQAQGGNYYDLSELRAAIDKLTSRSSPATPEQSDWYNKVMTPAMDQVLQSRVFQRVADFKPANPEGVIDFQGLEKGLQALFQVILPRNLLGEIIISKKAGSPPLTLGYILQRFNDQSPLGLQDSIANLMQQGYEGYVIADTIARSVYHASETYGTPTPAGAEYTKRQADIPPAVRQLLDFPLPGAAILQTFQEKDVYPPTQIPTIGMILEKLSDEEKAKLLKALQGNYVSRLIADDAIHQKDMQQRLAK